MAVPRELLTATASIIAEYREGEIEPPNAVHVERWLAQFDEGVRAPLITELNRVLSSTYISRKAAETFLSNLVANPALTGGQTKQFWEGAKFLDIQSRGSSQQALLEMLAAPLKAQTGLVPADCGKNPSCFIYLDDGLFGGNTILNSLREWLKVAPEKAVVHVIVIALHLGGQYYASERLVKATKQAGKTIEFKWWRLIELEDRRAHTYSSDVLRPTKIPEDPLVNEYVQAMQHKPVLRNVGSLGTLKLFSNDAGRELLEQQFLIKGALIRKKAPLLNVYARPLGNSLLETLGFGSTIVTFRNCPNNAPLAFWAGDPWYPLFPRKTN